MAVFAVVAVFAVARDASTIGFVFRVSNRSSCVCSKNCDVPKTRGFVDYLSTCEKSIHLVSRDAYLSKIATWGPYIHTHKTKINYILIVCMPVLQKDLYIFTKYLLKATFRLSSQKLPLLRTVSLDSPCT